MKISVFGLGYVGLALSILLSQKNNVVAYDVDIKKVDLINCRKSPIKDSLIDKYLKKKKLNLKAKYYNEIDVKRDKYIVIATPTNFDEKSNFFDTSTIEDVVSTCLRNGFTGYFIIKSTVPIGYTDSLIKKMKYLKILFSPEFLREGCSLYDNLYPSRIIVGVNNFKFLSAGNLFARELKNCSLKKDAKIMVMGSKEAESVKLFSNTYLALRISYFNELDTFAETKNLCSESIINGVCLDPRIGNFYNNPSGGYGGYCLPKDTKQLLSNYHNIPENLIEAVVNSNQTRKDYIVKKIVKLIINKKRKVIGIYRIAMKTNSDNFRKSAVLDLINNLIENKINVIIYEPLLNEYATFLGCRVVNNLKKFISQSSLIVANRLSSDLKCTKTKVYTRDLFSKN